MILNAAYEATMCAALIKLANTGCDLVYLTSLGGGAFGNKREWIEDARDRSLSIFNQTPLKVRIVSRK